MVRIDPWCYILAAVMTLLLPLNWALAAIFAAAVHELCHILVILALGGRIYGLQIGPGGAKLDTDSAGGVRELLSALAGPVGSLSLLFFLRRFPRLALCGGIQGLFNLLPVFPLDGGRIASCLAEMLCPGRARQILKALESLTVLAAGALAISAPVPLSWKLLFGALLLNRAFGKKPCKSGRTGVQ